MFGIGGDGERGLGRRLEQHVVDHGLVLPGDVGDRGGKREDEVEVADLKEIGLAFGQPFARCGALAFWAVSVAATVEGDDGVAACIVLAARDMSAEHCGAAALDRTHHLQLAEADMAGIGTAPCGTVVAEDVRNLQRWTDHRAARPALSASGGSLVLPYRTADRADFARRQSCRSPRSRNAPSSPACNDQAKPGSVGYPCRAQADAWQSCAAVCVALPACQCRPPSRPDGTGG